ncbi:hypothetical protein HWV62_23697 [Athelia sp. TMB]|nr:hypothetical protein HWV62_23697 [Athelia sp. TMB]
MATIIRIGLKAGRRVSTSYHLLNTTQLRAHHFRQTHISMVSCTRQLHQLQRGAQEASSAHLRVVFGKQRLLRLEGHSRQPAVDIWRPSKSSSSAIDDLLRAREPTCAVAYFFFDSRSGEVEFSLHENMLRSLISQLSGQCATMPTALIQVYGQGRHQPSLASLEDTLQNIADCFEHAFLIIDAVDECEDKDDFLGWVGRISLWRGGKLHLMLSSRLVPDVEDGLLSLGRLTRVRVTRELQNADILRYIQEKLSVMKRWNQGQRNLLQELARCHSQRDLDRQLSALPKGLEDAYERILLRSDRPDELKTLLQWLAFATRALTLAELADTIAVDFTPTEMPVYDPDLRYMDARHVLTVCYGFVSEFEGKSAAWFIRARSILMRE